MVNVYWIAKYPQIGNTSPHSHRFYQLLVPTGGEGTILIGETPYPALRGTALLARPDIPHGVFCEEASSPAKFIDIKFSVLNESFDRELDRKRRPAPPRGSPEWRLHEAVRSFRSR